MVTWTFDDRRGGCWVIFGKKKKAIEAAENFLSESSSLATAPDTKLSNHMTARHKLRMALFEGVLSDDAGRNRKTFRFLLESSTSRGEVWVANAILANDTYFSEVLPTELALLEVVRGNLASAVELAPSDGKTLRILTPVVAIHIGMDEALALESRINWGRASSRDGRPIVTRDDLLARMRLLGVVARTEQNPDARRLALELISDLASGVEPARGTFSRGSSDGYVRTISEIIAFLYRVGLSDASNALTQRTLPGPDASELLPLRWNIAVLRSRNLSLSDGLSVIGDDIRGLQILHRSLLNSDTMRDAEIVRRKAVQTILTGIKADVKWWGQHAQVAYFLAVSLNCSELASFLRKYGRYVDDRENFYRLAIASAARKGAEDAVLCGLALDGKKIGDSANRRQIDFLNLRKDWILAAAVEFAKVGDSARTSAFVDGVRRQGPSDLEALEIGLLNATLMIVGNDLDTAISLLEATDIRGDKRLSNWKTGLLLEAYGRLRKKGNSRLEARIETELDDIEISERLVRNLVPPKWCWLDRESYQGSMVTAASVIRFDRAVRASKDGRDDEYYSIVNSTEDAFSNMEKLCIQLGLGNTSAAIEIFLDSAATEQNETAWNKMSAVLASRI
ncbi:hypothetical protein [Shimia sp. R9_2]|uniref:hypothetical protein n=1 Tax=Shimia sp. R9_2 TaxID=2821112 RepID=UPI001ADC1222|nr:hypothetical protein [Shimia sp. R9_2]